MFLAWLSFKTRGVSLVPGLSVSRQNLGATHRRTWKLAPGHFIPKRVRRLQNLQLQVRCEIRVVRRLVPRYETISGNLRSRAREPQSIESLPGAFSGRTNVLRQCPVHGRTDFLMIFAVCICSFVANKG